MAKVSEPEVYRRKDGQAVIVRSLYGEWGANIEGNLTELSEYEALNIFRVRTDPEWEREL